MADWLERVLKTFVQAFLGVFIPTIVALLENGLPKDWNAQDVLSAYVMIVDEQLDVVEGYKEFIHHEAA